MAEIGYILCVENIIMILVKLIICLQEVVLKW